MRYVKSLSGSLKHVFVVHGEESQSLAWAETMRAWKPQSDILVPEYRQTVIIEP